MNSYLCIELKFLIPVVTPVCLTTDILCTQDSISKQHFYFSLPSFSKMCRNSHNFKNLYMYITVYIYYSNIYVLLFIHIIVIYVYYCLGGFIDVEF